MITWQINMTNRGVRSVLNIMIYMDDAHDPPRMYSRLYISVTLLSQFQRGALNCVAIPNCEDEDA